MTGQAEVKRWSKVNMPPEEAAMRRARASVKWVPFADLKEVNARAAELRAMVKESCSLASAWA